MNYIKRRWALMPEWMKITEVAIDASLITLIMLKIFDMTDLYWSEVFVPLYVEVGIVIALYTYCVIKMRK